MQKYKPVPPKGILNPLDPKSLRKCRACPSLGQMHTSASGNPKADVMVIGSQPTNADVLKSYPFAGGTGYLLDTLLQKAGLCRTDDCYVTLALKCMPEKMRKPTRTELRTCLTIWLKNEIDAVDPKVLLIIGRDAFEALGGSKIFKVDYADGVHIHGKKRDYLIIYAPGYHIRQHDPESFLRHADQLRAIVSGHRHGN